MTIDQNQLTSNGSPLPESFADLWDGYENVTKATEKGVFLLRDITKFFKKRIQSEDEYSKSLSKLVLKFEPTVTDGYIGPRLKNTWDQIRLETLTHSNHHENICNNISTHIIEPIEGLVVDLEQKLKIIHSEAEKCFIHYQESVAKLKKAKQNYDRLCKDSFEITGVSKGETQKVQKRAIKAAQDVIKADKEYRAQINETNSSQKQFLQELIPKIMNDLQRLEMVRIHMVKSYFLRYFKSMESTPQKFNSENESLLSLINSINNEDEIQDFVRKSKTTHKYPKPFEYEPYLDRFTSSPQVSSPQLHSPRDVHLQHTSSAGNLPTFPNHHITSSLSLSSDSLQSGSSGNSNSSSNSVNLSTSAGSGSGSSNSTPTKEKKPSGWGLKRFSSSISSSDRKLLNKQIQAIGVSHNGGNVFNCKIEDIMNVQKKKYPNLEVPFIVVFLKQKLIALDVYKTQGIFRVPGNVVDINSLKKRFDEGNYEVAANENVYTVASLLKLWLREITEPLFPASVYEACIEKGNKKEQVREIVSSLPMLNQKIISYIVEILQEASKPENVEHSKMNSDNLAMVFAPGFVRSPHTDPNILLGNIFREKEFVKNLIEGLTPLPVNDSLEGTLSTSPSSMESPPTSPIKKSTSPITTPISTPIKSITTPPTIKSIGGGSIGGIAGTGIKSMATPLSPIAEKQSPLPSTVKQQPPSTISLTTTQSHINLRDIQQTIQQQHSNQPTPSTPLSNPKINQIKSESGITTPQKDSSSQQDINLLHLMSPSEVKRRSDDVYLEDQERCKNRIDEIHTQLNELYSDITTIETTTYNAMQSSLLITKFTKSLEQFLTLEMWTLSLADIKDAIEKNKFVSPPPINFKIPSKLPKLTSSNPPIQFEISTSLSEYLRQWLINVTLTINRVNQFLCYLGGVVIRIHSPEILDSINQLFTEFDPRPPVNPKFENLTLEQSTIFIQKTIPLLDPFTPFSQDELNINIKVQDTITPASFSPALLSEPDNSNVCNSPTNINGSSDGSSDGKNNLSSLVGPSILVTSTGGESKLVSSSPSSNSNGCHAIISPSSSTTSFKFDDDEDDQDSDEIDLLEINNQLHTQMTEELKKKQQLYKQLIFDIIDLVKDKKKSMNSLDLSDSDSQLDIKSIAKLSLGLKRNLDTFIQESQIEIEDEVDPIINKENDPLVNLKIMTSHFCSRIIVILTSVLSNSNEFNSVLYELLLPFKD